MRGRMIGVSTALAAVAFGVGVHAPAARAAAPPAVAEVGGGGFGFSIVGPGGTNLNPVPVGVIPPGGGSFYAASDDKFIGNTEIGRAVVYGFGTPTPAEQEPYAFVDSRVGHVSIAGIHELTFAYIKTYCEWDSLGEFGENQAFGGTFAYYEGGAGGASVPTVDTPLPGGGHYIINEQYFEEFQGRQVIVVNGLHVWLADGTEYIVAQSSCDPLRPPLLRVGDSREGAAAVTGGVFNPWNNAVINEYCFDGVDNNGDGFVDDDDPACQHDYCGVDGINHLEGTELAGVASNVIEFTVLPTGVDPLDEAIRFINCYLVVPAEDFVDAVLDS